MMRYEKKKVDDDNDHDDDDGRVLLACRNAKEKSNSGKIVNTKKKTRFDVCVLRCLLENKKCFPIRIRIKSECKSELLDKHIFKGS